MGPKAVIDTNIFISSLGWGGKPRKVVSWAGYRFDLITSEEQLEEIERVLAYKHLQLRHAEELTRFIRTIATVVSITGMLDTLRTDPDDNIILETALVGGVTYIVTGDRHLLELDRFQGINIVTPAQFLREFS